MEGKVNSYVNTVHEIYAANGGRNGMDAYDGEGNTATIEKHAFDIAKKRLGDDDEGNTLLSGKNGLP